MVTILSVTTDTILTEDSVFYDFELELPKRDSEELFFVYSANKKHLNNVDSNWEGHELLFENLSLTAQECMAEACPDVAGAALYWEVMPETKF